MTESEAQELQRCKESPAYFFNKYAVLKDKEGNVLKKPVLTDEQIRTMTDAYQQWRAKHFRCRVSPEQYAILYEQYLKIKNKNHEIFN